MKKLRIKVFSVIFILLTVFTLGIIIATNAKTYFEKDRAISEFLHNVSRRSNKNKHKPELPPEGENEDKDIRQVYLDFTVYTIILDDDGKYNRIINNTFEEDIDEEKVEEIANKIIENHKDNYYVGNLYNNKYSYVFTPNKELVIIDNSNINKMLVNQLIFYIIVFIISEIIIFIITYLITNWIIDPVKKSFEKQKEFIADASHELKTPLAVMIASCDAYFNDKDEKWIHNMKNESERMTKLVTELLDLAKTEKEHELIMEDKNLSEIVEGTVLSFDSLFYENKIKTKYDIESNIYLNCNEDKIVELLTILIDNAINHCSNKGKININLYKKNKQIVLEVKNTGIPIKPEDEEKIFERFYKVDSSRNRNSNNYGLGLAIAKNIVERHNGKISASSDNKYTTFKVIWNQK